jgi:hypothetical protein
MSEPTNPEAEAKPPVIDLDALCKLEEIAAWLRMSPKQVLENVRAGRLPVVRINQRVFRFHPRTILGTKRSFPQ